MKSSKHQAKRMSERDRGKTMGAGRWPVYAAIGWTVLFAGMSFYWAMGGMLGTRSLGGAIYEKALHPDPSFRLVVWATGFVKLAGVLPLAGLLAAGIGPALRKGLSLLCVIAGVLMALYGSANVVTIALAAFGVLDFDLETYAIVWRLAFWEPFWVLGGILYVVAGRRGKRGEG